LQANVTQQFLYLQLKILQTYNWKGKPAFKITFLLNFFLEGTYHLSLLKKKERNALPMIITPSVQFLPSINKPFSCQKINSLLWRNHLEEKRRIVLIIVSVHVDHCSLCCPGKKNVYEEKKVCLYEADIKKTSHTSRKQEIFQPTEKKSANQPIRLLSCRSRKKRRSSFQRPKLSL